jgi:hypothetical protein
MPTTPTPARRCDFPSLFPELIEVLFNQSSSFFLYKQKTFVSEGVISQSSLQIAFF